MQSTVHLTPSDAVRDDPKLRTTLATIPAWMVHKTVVGTPLSYLVEYADDHVQIGCDLAGCGTDPLQVMEAFRQGVMAACHTVYGVPLSSAFAMGRIATQLTPDGEERLRELPSLALRVVFEPRYRGRDLSAAAVSAEMMHGDQVVGTASGELVVLPPDEYLRVRKGRERRDFHSEIERVAPERADVGADHEVLVGEGGDVNRQPVALDTNHLAFCDHSVDHVPGMTLLEAVRQALVVRGGVRRPRRWSARFLRYVELESTLVVDLSDVTADGGEVRVLDDDEPVLTVCLS